MGKLVENFCSLVILSICILCFQNCSEVSKGVLNPSSGGFSSDDDDFRDVDPDRPLLDQLTSAVMTGPSYTRVGECSGMFTVQVLNSFDEPVTMDRDFGLSSEGFLPDSTFSDPGCTNRLTSYRIPAGSDRLNFYMRGDRIAYQDLRLAIPNLRSEFKPHTFYDTPLLMGVPNSDVIWARRDHQIYEIQTTGTAPVASLMTSVNTFAILPANRRLTGWGPGELYMVDSVVYSDNTLMTSVNGFADGVSTISNNFSPVFNNGITCGLVFNRVRCLGNGGSIINVAGMDSDIWDVQGFGDWACANQDGTVHCWTRANPTPNAVAGLDGLTIVEMSISDQPCVVDSNGNVYCWNFGNGGMNAVQDMRLSDVRSVHTRAVGSAADRGKCAILNNGNVQCVGTFLTESGLEVSDTVVSGATDVVEITAGHGGSNVWCAAHGNGSLSCWRTDDFVAQGISHPAFP